MNDPLEEQFVNETCAMLRTINQKYKDLFHFSVLTVVPMEENSCEACKESNAECRRLVVGAHQLEKKDE